MSYGGTSHEPTRRRSPALYDLFRPYRARVLFLAVISASGGLVEALFLVMVTRAAFAVTDQRSPFAIVAGVEVTNTEFVLIALPLIFLRIALAIASAWQSARLSAGVVAAMRSDMASAYLGASWSVQHGERGGRLQELLTTFASQGAALVNAVAQTVISGCALAALLLIAVLVDPLSSIAVIGAVAVLGSALRPIRSAVRRQARRTSTAGMEFATGLSEMSHLGMEMHVFGVQPSMRTRVLGLVQSNEAATRRLAFMRNLVPAIYTGLAYVALVGALGVVAAIDSANLRTVGAVMLVMLRSLTYGQAMQTNIAVMNAAMPFVSTLEDELSRYRETERVDHGEPVGSIGELKLSEVAFEYDVGVPVLNEVTASIPQHTIVGIIGPSGSGKSTVVQLLLGLRDPTSGRVLSDGRDIRNLSRSGWTRKVTFVPQQARLLAGTVSDNIRFLRDDVSQADIERASKLANLHEDVEGFADGYDRQVGEQGSHLSGGQQQRLIIARALVEQPDVLILDEPTSALDVRSEALIRDTLKELSDRMTVIIIAHRLSTLDHCDRIMVIQDGELKAFDTPDNLEQSSEFYRESLRLSGLR